MKGIQFVVNDAGEKTAVVIDLAEHGDLWEDFYDSVVAESRRGEPSRPWDEVRQELGLNES